MIDKSKQELKCIKNAIRETLTERDLLEQLAEEAAELSKAAIKMIRANGHTKNVTPTSQFDAYNNLEDEINDVLVAIEALGFNLHIRADFATKSHKWERWYRRITDGTKHPAE